eukprot:62182-Hanusia_phi.AAC.2
MVGSEAHGSYAVIPWAFLWWVWLIWFLNLMQKTSERLSALPYLQSRFRQLSFRFFVLQSCIMAPYLFFTLAASVLWTGAYFLVATVNYNGFATDLLFEVYMILVAYIYLPVHKGNDKIGGSRWLYHLIYGIGRHDSEIQDRLHEYRVEEDDQMGKGEKQLDVFCLQTALISANFSWQAYMTSPISVDGAQGLQIPDDFELCKIVYKPDVDSRALICKELFSSAGGVRRFVVAFRGSNSLTNALTDLDMRRVRVPRERYTPHRNLSEILSRAFKGLRKSILHPVHAPLDVIEVSANAILDFLDGIKVHAGFWQAYESFAETLQEELMAAISGEERVHILITGHSLGGAFSQLLAMDLRLTLPADTEVSMYSFGAPRVGNRSWAKLYDALVPCSFRAVLRNDMISAMPSPPFYVHGGREVIIDPKGNIKCDPSFVEKVFRPSRNSLVDHKLGNYINALHRCIEAHDAIMEETEDTLSV